MQHITLQAVVLFPRIELSCDNTEVAVSREDSLG